MCPTKPSYHKVERVTNKKSWSSTDFNYNSSRWINIRNAYRNEKPLCEECKKKGIITPMNVVDHVTPISQGGSAWYWSNLQSLCTAHHNSKSRKEQQR